MLAVALAAVLGVQGTAAQTADVVVETMAVEYAFAQHITFRLEARSTAPITSAVVYFRAGSGPLHTGQATLAQTGTGVQASYTREGLGGSLTPFSALTYWWELGDATGRQVTTPSQTLDYIDNRFTWRSLADGNLRINWHTGDQTFGQTALDLARQILPQLNQSIAAPLPPQVEVYVYSNIEQVQSALQLAGRAWQGGQARPDLGVVLIAVPPGTDAALQLRRELAHELTHLLVYQATGSGYTYVPRWLDEGLAVLNEPSPDPAYQLALEAAFRANRLLPIETLCAPFASDAAAAQLAYAQSQSLVRFIRERYGNEGLRRLLAAYRDGAGCAAGVERGLGVSLGALELDWRAGLGPQGAWRAVLGSIGVWIVLAVMLLALPISFIIGKRKNEAI